MIQRDLQTKIKDKLFKGKAVIVIGARQVGKSTLMRQITESISEKVLMLNCDEPEVLSMLSGANTHVHCLRDEVEHQAQKHRHVAQVLRRGIRREGDKSRDTRELFGYRKRNNIVIKWQ